MKKPIVFKVSEYKSIELYLCRFLNYRSYFDIGLGWSRHTDHAGFYLYLSLFSFSLSFDLYDIRHWNMILNHWEPLPESEEKSEEEYKAEEWPIGI